MIGQNNNNTNNQSLNNILNNTPTPDKTKPQTNIYLNNTSTLNTSTPTTPPKILQLQTIYNLKQTETLTKMNEYKKWSEMVDYVQDNLSRVRLELAECDAKELKAFIDLYQEKMRLNEGEG